MKEHPILLTRGLQYPCQPVKPASAKLKDFKCSLSVQTSAEKSSLKDASPV